MRVRQRCLNLGLSIAWWVFVCGCDDNGGEVDSGPDDSSVDAEQDSGPPPCEGHGSSGDGEHCGCNADCRSGATCYTEVDSGVPGGICARYCEIEASDQCTESRICSQAVLPLDVPPGLGLCLIVCEETSDCPMGSGCTGEVCVPLCQDDAECLSGYCDHPTGLCTDGAGFEGAGVMEECLRDEDCASLQCDDRGRCISLCDWSRDGCPDGSRCVPLEISTSDLGYCQPSCNEQDRCELDGLTCAYAGYPAETTACFLLSDEAACLGRGLDVPDFGPCGCNDDCSPGSYCATEGREGWPHGRCLYWCDPDLEDQCASGYYCRVSSPETAVCMQDCRSHDDCGDGYLCLRSIRLCLNACETDEHCDHGSCDLYSGMCRGTTTAGLPMGETCDDREECRSRQCMRIGSYSQCTRVCEYSEQRCPDDNVCTDPDELGVGLCAHRCETPEDCDHAGARCVSSGGDLPNHCE